jgi:hypothetical protein
MMIMVDIALDPNMYYCSMSTARLAYIYLLKCLEGIFLVHGNLIHLQEVAYSIRYLQALKQRSLNSPGTINMKNVHYYVLDSKQFFLLVFTKAVLRTSGLQDIHRRIFLAQKRLNG